MRTSELGTKLKAEGREKDWELIFQSDWKLMFTSRGSHVDSYGSLARCLSRPSIATMGFNSLKSADN